METIIIEVKSKKQSRVFKEIAKALDADFRILDKKEKPYKPEFVEKIKQSENDFKAGRYKTIKTADLWK